MTLSFHKVMFSAQEILDLIAECYEEEPAHMTDLENFESLFLDQAEERSRENHQAMGSRR